MESDEQLESRIRHMFLQDGRLSSQPIEVSISRGVVALRGRVQSYGRRLAATEIAGSVNGVTGVIDELHVEPPGHLADGSVAEYVRQALAARADVSHPTIAVSVSSAAVEL